MLVRAGGRLAIVVEPSLFSSPTRRTRLRFTLAHELAHLVLDEVAASSPRGPVYIEYSQRERLCNLLASNLLIPRDCLISCLQETQTDPEVWREGDWVHAQTLLDLRRRFQVSLPALSAAVREISPGTAVLRLERMLPLLLGGRGNGIGKFRVAWSSPTTPRGNAVFLKQSLPSETHLGMAVAKGETFRERTELTWRPLPKGSYLVSGAPAGSTGKGTASYLVTICVGQQRARLEVD